MFRIKRAATKKRSKVECKYNRWPKSLLNPANVRIRIHGEALSPLPLNRSVWVLDQHHFPICRGVNLQDLENVFRSAVSDPDVNIETRLEPTGNCLPTAPGPLSRLTSNDYRSLWLGERLSRTRSANGNDQEHKPDDEARPKKR
jgi:hypothetical protein